MKRLPMGSPIGSGSGNFFCSISRGRRVLYSHGGDGDAETLAAAAAESAPPFHSRYCHTAGNRTFAYLIDDDGHTYFAIADTASGKARALRFLELMRDGFRRASRNNVHDELVPVVRRMITSLETLSRLPPAGSAGDDSPPKSMTAAAEAPLLARGSGDGKVEESGVGDLWIEVPEAPAGMTALQKNLSSRNWMQQNGHGRRLWWRHVKIVIVVDFLICLVLFGIWLAVCRGFQCIA